MPSPDDANPSPRNCLTLVEKTYETLHLWTQIVGKIRAHADALAQSLPLARHVLHDLGLHLGDVRWTSH